MANNKIASFRKWSFTEMLHATGKRKAKVFLEHKNTGNPAVDAVAASIIHYNRQGRPVKTIYLYGIYWKLFHKHVEYQMKKAGVKYQGEDQPISFAGVDLKEGSFLEIGKKMRFEFLNKDETPIMD